MKAYAIIDILNFNKLKKMLDSYLMGNVMNYAEYM